MTFVGKILVMIIMAFALFFLAISTVVFTTSKNWKDEAASLKKSMSELQSQKTAAEAKLAEAEAASKRAEDEKAQMVEQLNAQIASIEQKNQLAQQELTEQREAATRAEQQVQVALNESAASLAEAQQLRGLLSQVQDQANKFQLAQQDLDARILELERMLAVAQDNNRELLERVGLYSNVIRRAGLSDDVRRLRGVTTGPPPDFKEGQVLEVDPTNRRVVISVGSDDGLVVGHELELFRTQPTAEYLGRIRVDIVEPDRAVGTVIGGTVQGKKIQEGDLVSPQIRPRS